MDEVFMAYDRWAGLITLLLGVYASLVAYGYLPRNPKDPAKVQEWRKKFGGLMQVLGPLVVLFGLVTLVIGLSSAPVNPSGKRVLSEFYRANDARAARGANIQSAEHFLADLQKIDLSNAPPDLSSAVRDYTQALADGLAAVKTSKRDLAADAKMTEAKKRLEAIELNYRR